MPSKRTLDRARQAEEEGKAPSTQAGEFVREEIENIRKGKHGARSAKQAIAIGLSKARRAGVKLPPPRQGKVSEATRRKAEKEYQRARSGEKTSPSSKRARGTLKALRRESGESVSKESLSQQTRSTARRRTQGDRSLAGTKAARTRASNNRKRPPVRTARL
ncbi:MAG: DNA-binding protein [Verrucomicrobia bacterium]|nr:DNA-binding protein [Verrucomicrobiota bacterium]